MNNQTSNLSSAMTAKEFFFDRLESYFDFREKNPEIAAKVLPDLLQACYGVSTILDTVNEGVHRIMISKIVGEGFDVEEWGRAGYPLGGAALALINQLGVEGEAA